MMWGSSSFALGEANAARSMFCYCLEGKRDIQSPQFKKSSYLSPKKNHLTPSFWRIWTAQQTIIISHVTHLYGLTSWVLKSKRNNMTTEHENGKESVLYWILFSVFANLELLLLVHWRPISQISYTFNCLDLSL